MDCNGLWYLTHLPGSQPNVNNSFHPRPPRSLSVHEALQSSRFFSWCFYKGTDHNPLNITHRPQTSRNHGFVGDSHIFGTIAIDRVFNMNERKGLLWIAAAASLDSRICIDVLSRLRRIVLPAATSVSISCRLKGMRHDANRLDSACLDNADGEISCNAPI